MGQNKDYDFATATCDICSYCLVYLFICTVTSAIQMVSPRSFAHSGLNSSHIGLLVSSEEEEGRVATSVLANDDDDDGSLWLCFLLLVVVCK